MAWLCALPFGAGIFWAQVMLLSGLRVWYGTGGFRAYSTAAVLDRVFELPEALERLAVLAYPYRGAVAWLIASVFLCVGLAQGRNATRGREDQLDVNVCGMGG